ncbi:PTS mannose/fructose/sorbose family IIA subunit [Lachnospiraceae bacterium OttesenSCG-928-D06]|nr:PTS mannose/fructose/sorbose family IIA subunit [Lachnospiraceae bacterium OttesenSCG-928-D06]
MKELAVIIASHGNYAKEALVAAEMIVGKQENCATLSVTDVKNLDTCLLELEEICNKLDTSRGLLFLVDMYGGTPCNSASNMLLKRQEHMEIELLSGFNLPMLLEVFMDRELPVSELKDSLVEAYPGYLKDLGKILNEESEENDATELG